MLQGVFVDGIDSVESSFGQFAADYLLRPKAKSQRKLIPGAFEGDLPFPSSAVDRLCHSPLKILSTRRRSATGEKGLVK
jgi:hypothetical protein